MTVISVLVVLMAILVMGELVCIGLVGRGGCGCDRQRWLWL